MSHDPHPNARSVAEPSACGHCGIPDRENAECTCEEWRELPDLPGYRIYGNGEIWGPSKRKLRPHANSRGYLTFAGPRARPHKQKMYQVHQVVCRAFHGEQPFPGAVVRHLDGEPLNNVSVNLSWGTHLENAEDRDRHGRTARGEENPAAKLTLPQVEAIKATYCAGGVSQLDLARSFGVSRSLIGQIVREEIWPTAPSSEQILARMKARRANRTAR